MRLANRERGQAAVESALVLPLTVFLILGSLQLFLLQQSRISAQYAAFQAARVGATSNGACEPITHAALLSVLPNVDSFIGNPNYSGSPAKRLGAAFTRFKDNHYGGYRWGTWKGPGGADESVVWITREGRAPTVADVVAWDQPLSSGEPFRMEIRLVYWAPLRVPFADWVYARIAAARYGLIPYTNYDPLAPTKTSTDWSEGGAAPLDALVAGEFNRRIAAGHYVFPITVSSTMRMMSPPRLSEFLTAGCPSPGFAG